ncbi:peroxidase-like [Linepithema humile]|uniref:peroxidase-like n=1 Tax=Linepithema humile TaxID=83485 RepID=UPI00062327E4|nr:PREDICTED: peroxidase-like isoform X2 [Linepithema humile]
MKGHNGLWITSFLIAVLLQTLTITNAKDATKKKHISPSHKEQEEEFSDLEASETSFYGTFSIQKNLLNTYHPTVYHASNPTFSYISSSSSFPNTIFPTGQNLSSIHDQIRCGDTFSQACQQSRYRSYDGSCNNLRNPTWGLANTRYGRLVRARYSDGIRAPSRSITGLDLPSARLVSYTLFPDTDVNDNLWTLAAMQYGQIITHDMGLIDGTTQSKPHGTRCCTTNGQLIPESAAMPQCFPILIPFNDPVYGNTHIQCMNFVRSTTDLDRGCSSPYKPAEQLNTVSNYLDLSIVYGSSDQVAASLRAGFGGRLNVELKNNREFPPSPPNKTAICDVLYEFEPCYATGDMRANQNPQLTILQIILLREHNRVADFLAQLNPHWTDETIFQETRRIVIAEHQNIAYYEWLPIFLGDRQILNNNIVYNTANYVNDYDETVIAHVLNEHSNAAFRYFHTNIAGRLDLVSERRQYSPSSSLRLSDYFNRPGIIERGNNLDDLARGLCTQAQKQADVYFDREITQFFFRRGRALGSDLRAIDIQRDRDHGLASYNDYREYCGLPRAKAFTDFADYISLQNIQKLASLYVSVDDVEVTVGGSLEMLVPGTLSGPTFLCIMLKQFQLTRIGDRYWFETGDSSVAFTLEQLNELRKSSISRLICDNGDNIQIMQKSGFLQVSETNPLSRCDELPEINLSLWKDYNPQTSGHTYQDIVRSLYKKK